MTAGFSDFGFERWRRNLDPTPSLFGAVELYFFLPPFFELDFLVELDELFFLLPDFFVAISDLRKEYKRTTAETIARDFKKSRENLSRQT